MRDVDVDAYFARTGYAGSRSVTRATLDAIVLAHSDTIPFENVDVLLGKGVSLDDDAVFAKLVTRRRGGYCFEQNNLLGRVLRALGFAVTPLSGRVRVGRTRDMTPQRSHLFLKVAVDGIDVFADVGIGGMTPTSTLLPPTTTTTLEQTQQTPHEPRRFVSFGGTPERFIQQAFRQGAGWIDVVEFTGEEMPPIDQTVANWFTSTSPASRFKSCLMAARSDGAGRRFSLVNLELTTRDGDQSSTRTLGSAVEAVGVLHDVFGLRDGVDVDVVAAALDAVLPRP